VFIGLSASDLLAPYATFSLQFFFEIDYFTPLAVGGGTPIRHKYIKIDPYTRGAAAPPHVYRGA
jgi:hypothetical protein